MRKLFPNRGLLLFVAVVLVAAGVLWTNLAPHGESLGLSTTGTVVSVRRDSLGCATWVPFARTDCRVIVKIKHRVEGMNVDATYSHVASSHFFPVPSPEAGSAVSGTCSPTGRCEFKELAAHPYALYLSLTCFAGAFLVLAWILRRNKK